MDIFILVLLSCARLNSQHTRIRSYILNEKTLRSLIIEPQAFSRICTDPRSPLEDPSES